MESAGDISGLISTATGGFVSKRSDDIERGNEVVAGVLVECLENGNGIESELAERFQLNLPIPCCTNEKTNWKTRKNGLLSFVVLQPVHVVLLHNSLKFRILVYQIFGDILDDGVYEQIEYWMHERVQMREKVHLFGSIPCGPFSPTKSQSRSSG